MTHSSKQKKNLPSFSKYSKKDPDPKQDPDPDQLLGLLHPDSGCPKTRGSGGSGLGTLAKHITVGAPDPPDR